MSAAAHRDQTATTKATTMHDDTPESVDECESCGRSGDAVTEVRRVYVKPDDPTATTVVDDTEWWCPSCLVTYPHQLVE